MCYRVELEYQKHFDVRYIKSKIYGTLITKIFPEGMEEWLNAKAKNQKPCFVVAVWKAGRCSRYLPVLNGQSMVRSKRFISLGNEKEAY